ncbi:hypothetical protein [Bradyrhizobium icense]
MSLKELVRTLSRLRDPSEAVIWRPGFSDWQTAGSVPDVAAWIARPPDLQNRASSAPRIAINSPANNAKPTRIIRTEKRKRGFFGWLFLILFLLFNGLMVAWLFSYWSAVLPMATTGSEAGRAGAAIGTTLGTGFIISIWTCGSIVLGLFVLFTRGRKVIVEEERR